MKKETVDVYDFDKTVYDGDCTVHFYMYCLRHHLSILLRWPHLILCSILFLLRIIGKTAFKEYIFRFLRSVPDIDKAIDDFWIIYKKNLKGWYLEQKKNTDIINSASPEFLLEPICRELGVRLIGSRVDKITGLYTGLNNHDEEKVARLKEEYPDVEVLEFYSDSLSDTPMAEIAQKAFLVDGDNIKPWPVNEL